MKPSKKRFEEAAKEHGGIISSIAKAFKVNRKTIYTWMDADSEFKDIIDECRGQLVDVCMKSAELLARGIPIIDEETKSFIGWKERPDGNMIRYLLGTFGSREGFGDRIDITSKSESIKPMEPIVLTFMGTQAEYEKIISEVPDLPTHEQ